MSEFRNEGLNGPRKNPATPPRSIVDWTHNIAHFPTMSTVTEIEKALPNLTNDEWLHVEALLHSVQRARGVGIIFDDAYGVWTEVDQTSVVAEAWDVIDSPPKKQ